MCFLYKNEIDPSKSFLKRSTSTRMRSILSIRSFGKAVYRRAVVEIIGEKRAMKAEIETMDSSGLEGRAGSRASLPGASKNTEGERR